MPLIISIVVGAIVLGAVAARKNRNILLWAILGPLVPLALPVLLMLPRLCINCGRKLSRWDGERSSRCPHCGKDINDFQVPADKTPQRKLPAETSADVTQPAASIPDIEAAMRSGDDVEKAWAREEITRLPAEDAGRLRKKYQLK